MPQKEQHNNQWHSDHFIFSLSFCLFFGWGNLSGRPSAPQNRTKSGSVLNYSFFKTKHIVRDIWSWSKSLPWVLKSVTFSHNRAKIVMDPPERRGYGSYLRMSVCVASSFNFSLFPSNAKTLSYTQRSASYHLYHYPAWHRDWLLPYHMADWILCAAGGFAGGFLCSVCTLCPAV